MVYSKVDKSLLKNRQLVHPQNFLPNHTIEKTDVVSLIEELPKLLTKGAAHKTTFENFHFSNKAIALRKKLKNKK
jgi:hypothetical protein